MDPSDRPDETRHSDVPSKTIRPPRPGHRNNGTNYSPPQYGETEAIDTPELREQLREMAGLSWVQYGLERDGVAQNLGIHVRTLDDMVERARNELSGTTVPKIQSLIITDEEYEQAKITPRCIVENYLYADTALLLAAGGTGKTTLQLYEAVHIVLGLPLYGFTVVSPGIVLIVTAEDSRELLIARLRRIVVALGLSDVQRRAVQSGVRILDLSAQISRLVVSDSGGNLQLTPLVDHIIEACKGDEPVLTAFDPAISFGAGESHVNDNEQALITASRRIVRSLDCCVRYAHHLGKEAARNKTMDQYAGRSGSALPDGSRMVVVLQPWSDKQLSDHSPPEAFRMTDDSQVMLLNRPKLSYAAPQGLMWIQRRSYSYEYAADLVLAPEVKLSQNADQVERFLLSELTRGRRYSQNDLLEKAEVLNMAQKEIRGAVSELKISERVSDRPTGNQTRGGPRTYLHPKQAE